jgi:PAS domain S-box-containing protein
MASSENDQQFLMLADAAPILIWACDCEGSTLFFNKAWLRFTGRTLEQELGNAWTARMHPDDYVHCAQVIAAALKQPAEFKIEYRLRRWDGVYRWIFDQAVPRLGGDGSFLGFMGFCTDITEQKLAQAAEEQQRTLAETLTNLTLALTSHIHLDDLLDEILRQVQHLFKNEACNVMLLDGDVMRIVRWYGYLSHGSEAFMQTLAQPLDAFPIHRELVSTRKAIVIANTREDPRWHIFPETTWIMSNIAAPICFQDRLLGELRLDSVTPNRFSQEDAIRLEPLTHAAAVALMNAQLYEQIHQAKMQLEERVAQRTAELATANEQLKELDRLKSQFVADVSHELRTPISVLSLKLELLARKPERFAEQLPNLQKQVDTLTALISDILDISRLELGHDKIEFSAVDLNALIEQVVAIHYEKAEAVGLQIMVQLDKALPAVQGEANQLAQVITNLLANAIKYTPAGSVHVTTAFDQVHSAVRFEVRDTGSGIYPDDLPHLFERFYRGKRVGSMGIPGTGLGLAIVKEILDLHGGRIEIESEFGQGSTFKVMLPCIP